MKTRNMTREEYSDLKRNHDIRFEFPIKHAGVRRSGSTLCYKYYIPFLRLGLFSYWQDHFIGKDIEGLEDGEMYTEEDGEIIKIAII